MDITLGSALLVLACGVVVGILSAMFGIGGGTIMVPLIHLVFGQPAAVASGTSIFAILPTSISSMVARLHDGTIKFPIGLAMGVMGACFSPLGAYAASTLPGMYAMILTSVFIFYSAYKMFNRVWKTRPEAYRAAAAGQARQPRRAPLAGVTGARLWGWSIAIGAIVGFIAGYVGLGGGFIIVPVLQFVYGFTMKESTGTSLVAVACIAVPGVVAHAYFGNIAWVIGLLLIAGSLAGTRIGARILKHVNDRLLTGLFGVVLLIAGAILASQELLG